MGIMRQVERIICDCDCLDNHTAGKQTGAERDLKREKRKIKQETELKEKKNKSMRHDG